MLKVIGLFVMGAVLGGMFVNAKFETKAVVSSQAEVVYGTRIDSNGNLVVLTSR